jgi:preprotein translocase subunit YajC
MTLLTPLLTLLAETPAPQGFDPKQLLMPAVLIVMFYMLLIRPQQKQRKEQQARIAALKSGDKVVTGSGIHGIVHSIKDQTVMVKVAEGTTIEFDKMAIVNVAKKDNIA